MKLTINHIIILLLIGVILYLRACESKKPDPEPVIITKEIVRWDTVRISTIEYVPQWKEKQVPKWDTVIEPVDTSEILKDYFARYFYEDTITLDTLGYIVIQDTVTENKIVYRGIDPVLGIPTTIIDKTVYLNNNEFYWGPSVTGRLDGLTFVGADLLYRNKRRQMFKVGLGVGPELTPSVSLGYYMRIGGKQ